MLITFPSIRIFGQEFSLRKWFSLANVILLFFLQMVGSK